VRIVADSIDVLSSNVLKSQSGVAGSETVIPMMIPLGTVSNQGILSHYPLLPENAEPEAHQAVADGVARVSDNAEAPPTASHSLSILRISIYRVNPAWIGYTLSRIIFIE
jgi:hypothetical protein